MDSIQYINTSSDSTSNEEGADQTILKRPEPEASSTPLIPTSVAGMQELKTDVSEIRRDQLGAVEEENNEYLVAPVLSPQPPPLPNITSAQLQELQQALIDFITQSSRIFLAAHAGTWTDFYNSCPILDALHDYYSIEELRDEFVNIILPIIYNYALTERQQSYLDLLNLHPNYKRTPEGFALLAANERPLSCREPKVNKDFRLVTHANANNMFTRKSFISINNDFRLDSDAIALGDDHHTLVVPESAMKFEIEMSPLKTALLSAALSNDYELAANVVLDIKVVKARLNAAKRNFEQHARMLQNVLDHKRLTEKVQKIVNMRCAVEDILISKYCL